MITCADKLTNCPQISSFCGTGAIFNGMAINDTCPRTCGVCTRKFFQPKIYQDYWINFLK